MRQETCRVDQAGAWPALRRRMLPGWRPKSRLQLSGAVHTSAAGANSTAFATGFWTA